MEKFKIPLVLATAGVILLGAGFLLFSSTRQEDKIEIISSDSEENKRQETIFADIEGAVQKPGVYELPSGARVEDLLIAAGGVSNEADRQWIEKSLNQAQKLVDGVKIYIPKTGEGVAGAISSQSSKSSGSSIGSEGRLVNINSASQSELEALWGVGPVTAQKIIENRPYQSAEELLTKKILKSNVYQRIAEQLTVY